MKTAVTCCKQHVRECIRFGIVQRCGVSHRLRRLVIAIVGSDFGSCRELQAGSQKRFAWLNGLPDASGLRGNQKLS